MRLQKIISLIIVISFCAVATTATGQEPAPTPTPVPAPGTDEFTKYVLNKIDDQYRGNKSHGIMTMEIKTSHWTRSVTAESWSMGKNYSLIRILKPRKEKGSATLKADNVLFTYLSKTGRTIKISSGMMGGSWMGSHFTNDDLVQNTRLADDFETKMSFDGQRDGQKIYEFTLIPKPDAPVVWGKIVVVVRAEDLQPLKQEYFDEDLKKMREMVFSDHKEVSGRLMPTKMIMRPMDEPGEFTMITWDKIDFSVKLSKGFFSLQKLKSL